MLIRAVEDQTLTRCVVVATRATIVGIDERPLSFCSIVEDRFSKLENFRINLITCWIIQVNDIVKSQMWQVRQVLLAVVLCFVYVKEAGIALCA